MTKGPRPPYPPKGEGPVNKYQLSKPNWILYAALEVFKARDITSLEAVLSAFDIWDEVKTRIEEERENADTE